MTIAATVRIEDAKGTKIRLWLPLILLWLLLPLAILIAPFFAVFCLIKGINPISAACALIGLWSGLSGVHIEIKSAKANILVHVV
ncbi:MAG: hypothetical protein WAW96_14655 [Alphaproteobacteria bacterium]